MGVGDQLKWWIFNLEKDEKMTNIQLESEDILHKKRIQKKPSKICSANLWQKKWNRKIDAQETTIQLVSDSEHTLHKKNVKKPLRKLLWAKLCDRKKGKRKMDTGENTRHAFKQSKLVSFDIKN